DEVGANRSLNLRWTPAKELEPVAADSTAAVSMTRKRPRRVLRWGRFSSSTFHTPWAYALTVASERRYPGQAGR
ncbi:MAG TPA: hypothetical protein VFQ54_00735, partial [Thermomicrobiales bacterium]|nr:hypothetical protein [Thermomicrobiales bacterium]